MSKSMIVKSRQPDESNVFSNISALVLFWLLVNYKKDRSFVFAMNQIARELTISPGTVHRVINQLHYDGIVKSKGLRTNKQFTLDHPDQLLLDWINNYQITKKTKVRGFAQADANSIIQRIGDSRLIPALHHAAADLFKVRATNLKAQEFYLLPWANIAEIVSKCGLIEMDRGYEVLFVRPYYQSLVKAFSKHEKNPFWFSAYGILTFLDLCHYPLRGFEQAEALYHNHEVLKLICPWSKIEDAFGK